ncbi:YceD family protein [Bogoriella caseilytica]|uniref:DUF177 domain-containing protein n=1 Tax=Bogoriella caseilytica TaxID=56055 RepID=A0A3N2B9G5_9MICO|nr:DUF177 domain-containing protein [Bogoriella caseilytica]ROR71913.1 uncharacterized protein EDD31_0252 [Bogoriella caseilytica]
MDFNAPLVLSTYDLGRRAGAMRTEQLTVPAPSDLGTVVIAIPPGTDVELHLQFEAVMDGVFVTGSASGLATGECARCLDPLQLPVEVDIAELYLYEETKRSLSEAGDDEAEDQYMVTEEHIDLEPVLRDAVVTALPFRPLCRDDCPGLCPVCGIRMAEAESGHAHEQIDPRWKQLQQLLGEESSE